MSVPAGMVLLPAARGGVEQAERLGSALYRAATHPLYQREVLKDANGERLGSRTAVSVPAWAVLAGAALIAVAAQRGVRTGTLRPQGQTQWTSPRARAVWVPDGASVGPYLPPSKGPWTPGKKRVVPTVRYRDNVADYQPWFR